jgi:MFS family permease
MSAQPVKVIRPDMVPPDAEERRRRRRRHVTLASAGGALGLAIGIVLVVVISNWGSTGSWQHARVFLFGLPALLLVGGTVVGTLFSMVPEAADVDAPVRDARGPGQAAATSEQGQLPGSPVAPDRAPADAPTGIPDLPSQRPPDDDEAGREVERTEWAERGPRQGPREY